MKNRSKRVLFTLLLAGSVLTLSTGCSKLKKTEDQTEAQTEAPTEAPTEKVTEAPTEKETEPPTEEQTEAPTEKETEPKILTAEEEKAQETDLDQIRMMYAKDDINVRYAPDTSTSENIIYSYMQGDKVTVVGETPNWYVVEIDDYEEHGYVSKQFISADEVAEKTEEERQEAIEKELSGTQNGTGDAENNGSTPSADTSADTSAVDQKYDVRDFAESYTVQAATGANIRSTPAQDGEIVGTIASNTIVTALGETDRWYKVEYNGTVGYVNKNLFK